MQMFLVNMNKSAGNFVNLLKKAVGTFGKILIDLNYLIAVAVFFSCISAKVEVSNICSKIIFKSSSRNS